MADKKITDLTLLSTPDATDVFAIVDVDASETKKLTVDGLQESIFNQNTGSFFKSASIIWSNEPVYGNYYSLLLERGNETTASVDFPEWLETRYTASLLVTSSLNDHTMTFTKGDGSTYDLTLPGGSGSVGFNSYLVPTIITGSTGDRTVLTGSIYENTSIFRLTWDGGNGIHQLILPDATSNTNAYRTMRFISDGTATANDEFYLTCSLDQTLDGSSNEFQIDRGYEGIMVWSDGTEWFRIQTKA